jgi:hypothetical protein
MDSLLWYAAQAIVTLHLYWPKFESIELCNMKLCKLSRSQGHYSELAYVRSLLYSKFLRSVTEQLWYCADPATH